MPASVDDARAKSLFLVASDLSDAAERAAFLDRECSGDDALAVEALLRDHLTKRREYLLKQDEVKKAGKFDPKDLR